MKLYADLLVEKIQQQSDEWSQAKQITQREMYTFFHSLKGTAGTIGFHEVSVYSEKILLQLNENSPSLIDQRIVMNYIHHVKTLIMKSKTPCEKTIQHDEGIVLIIDHDLDFVTEAKPQIEAHGFQVAIALTLEKGLGLLYALKPSFILLEIDLEDQKDIDIIEKMVERARKLFIPIALVSKKKSPQQHIQAYQLGATDFIGKPLDLTIFIPYLKNRIASHHETVRSVIVDELTGAYNRKHLNVSLKESISNFNRTKQTFSLVLLDLDFFKKVNDQHGHLKGDEVLQRFSSVIRTTKRESDLFFRYGGEEFALLYPHTSVDGAKKHLNHLRETFSKESFTCDTGTFNVTFSAGITSINEDNQQVSILLEEADQALYCAKNSGRNQAVVFQNDWFVKKEITPLHIFIVDDDLILRDMMTDHFSTWQTENYSLHVESYPDGDSFLKDEWYEQGHKYVILLDGVMPNVDGLDVLEKVKSDFPEEDVLVSMLTARKEDDDIVKALEMGADDYIQKPFNPREVTARIQRLVHRMF